MNHPHVEPPQIPLIQEKHDGKSDKDFVKLKLCRDAMSSKSDLYESGCYQQQILDKLQVSCTHTVKRRRECSINNAWSVSLSYLGPIWCNFFAKVKVIVMNIIV